MNESKYGPTKSQIQSRPTNNAQQEVRPTGAMRRRHGMVRARKQSRPNPDSVRPGGESAARQQVSVQFRRLRRAARQVTAGTGGRDGQEHFCRPVYRR